MSLSAHMVDSFERKPSYAPYTSSRPPRPTMPQTPFTPFGADQSFAGDSWIEGHGYPPPRPSGSVGGFSRWSEEKVAALQVRLAKKLGPEYVTQRPGPGGGPKLSYVEGWKVINLANEVFGFNGWSSSIVSLTTDFLDVNDQGRVSVNVTAIVRITLADGCWHEDVGCGQGENIKSKGGALDKAKKEAVTDATKRALKTFGNVLGNCLYDKEYTKEIVKIKVPPTKFGTHDLERRPEFAEPSAPGPSRQTASAVPSHMSNALKPVIPTHQTPQQPARNETVNPRPGTPIRDINDLSDGDFFMDENYDAEFAGLDEQSFINQSTSKQNISPTKPQQQQQPPAAGPSRMGPPGVSEYHHRHRPDPPPTTNARPAPNTGGAAARQAALLAANATEPVMPADPPTKPNMSSGSSDTLFDTPTAQRRPPQGVPPPDGSSRPVASAPTAQSARALAIAAALANSARADSPRADSPRIPDGGINAVVAKTSNRIAASAVTLGLEKEVSVSTEDENTSGLAFGGFTSARGMKRSTSSGDRGAPQSPTKMSGRSEWIPPHLAGQQRRPLGELGVVPEGRGHGESWEAKRPRGF